MIGYKDITYCPFWNECSGGKECPRALTKEVMEAATKWWGSEDAPISMYMDKPHCFKEE